MIKPLTDYITETTPFLRRVFITGNPAGIKGVGKMGYGPLIGDSEKLAEESENALVSSYIDSWIRGQIYLHACKHGFRRIEGCSCTLIPQREQLYPLRADAEGKPINPMVIVGTVHAEVNPLWKAAPQEFFFGVTQDALRLNGNVTRAFQTDRWFFKILLEMRLPQDAVCVELRPRTE